VVFDVLFGISFAIKVDAYNKFIRNLNGSMKAFGKSSSPPEPLLLFVTPTTLWNHLQKKGKCCGFKSHSDWTNTPFGKQKSSLPDTCCVKIFKDCGLTYVDPEPDEGEWDTLVDELDPASEKKDTTTPINIQEQGCLSVFSELVRSDANHSIDYTGKMIMAVLLLCFVLCLVLIFLIACRAFRPANGLLYPEKVGRIRSNRVHPDADVHHSISSINLTELYQNINLDSDYSFTDLDESKSKVALRIPPISKKTVKTLYEHKRLDSDNSFTELDE